MTHTTPTSRRRVAAAVLAAVLPFAAACSSNTPAGPATSSGSSSTTASSTTPSTSATTPAETSTASGAEAAYCEALRTGQSELRKISGTLSDQAALKQGLATLRTIQATAPDEVKGAWRDFVAFVEAATSGNTSALAGAMAKMSAAMTTIEQHARTVCGIDLS